MKHFHRTHIAPAEVLRRADDFFGQLGLATTVNAPRERIFAGPLGTVRVSATSEGGHYTYVQADTDQMGESRLDKNVKSFFVLVHRAAEPTHTIEASF